MSPNRPEREPEEPDEEDTSMTPDEDEIVDAEGRPCYSDGRPMTSPVLGGTHPRAIAYFGPAPEGRADTPPLSDPDGPANISRQDWLNVIRELNAQRRQVEALQQQLANNEKEQ